MPNAVPVLVHPSQFPDQVRRGLLESLRRRQVQHKYLYDGVKQTQKWLTLHEAYSPARTDPDCLVTYEKSFRGTIARLSAGEVHVVGLGCGGGQKDARLLSFLREAGKRVAYTPVDVSTAMVLTARQAALAAVPGLACTPVVLDLGIADDVAALMDEVCAPGQTRLITFMGMIPNFEPQMILRRLSELVRPADALLLSANLAPGPDYEQGVLQILPAYDNDLTHDWLLGFLLDLGIEKSDGEIRFKIEEEPPDSGLLRVAAGYEFRAARELRVDNEMFAFQPGDTLRLFFSYRHTPALIAEMLRPCGLSVAEQWITRSGEEGVFLGFKKPGAFAAPL